MDLVNLFMEFQRWNPSLVKPMRDCSHHAVAGDEIINPWHMCDDVWSHTCMVYRHFLNLIGNETHNKHYFYTGIAILCHDIGKVHTRKVKENGHVSFHSHPFAFIQETIDFIYYLKRKGLIEDIEEAIYITTNLVSNHIDFHREKSLLMKWEYANKDENLFIANLLLNVCDDHGRISYKGNRILTYEDFQCHFLSALSILDDVRLNKISHNDKKIVFLVGPPAAGKNTYLNNKSAVSFDDIRMEVYQRKNDIDGMDNITLYKKAFEYCNENKIDLTRLLVKKAKELLETEDVVYINNTNMGRKARRSIINSLGRNYDYESIILANTTQDLVHRNYFREDKKIPLDVLDKMMKNYQIPTYKEGFSKIEVKFNGTH